jgi:hypothetical protein
MNISDKFVVTGVRKNGRNQILRKENKNEYSIWLEKTLILQLFMELNITSKVRNVNTRTSRFTQR